MKVKPSKEGTNFETSFRCVKIAPVDTKENQEVKAKLTCKTREHFRTRSHRHQVHSELKQLLSLRLQCLIQTCPLRFRRAPSRSKEALPDFWCTRSINLNLSFTLSLIHCMIASRSLCLPQYVFSSALSNIYTMIHH
jgi:hypothetical protein